MRKHNITVAQVLVLVFFLCQKTLQAQTNTYESVLSRNTWHRLAVTREGVYKLDYDVLQAIGIDMTTLNPLQIRLFGNPAGPLPEMNGMTRPNDLKEMAIFVTGDEDGAFDKNDLVLFYGQEPTRWKMVDTQNRTYQRERNYYTDTTYYYLCVDSGTNGLRVTEKPTLPVDQANAVIADFPDFVCHEAEEFSPYYVSRNWLGERISFENPSLNLSFVFPNLVKTKPLTLKTQVLGRVSERYLYYSVRVNDNLVADNVAIKFFGSNSYGRLATIERQIMLDSDTANFELSLQPNPLASMYLDYVELYGWRQLKRVGSMFLFRLLPSQFGNASTAVWIQDVNSGHWLWEVSSPLRPSKQNGVLSGGNLVFATNEKMEKRYVMFRPSEAFNIDSWTKVPNQNLHAISEADMLILTVPLFFEQAQALADYHAERDGMRSVVVDVNEVYNEFSTGVHDPTGIRDFVRMVYQRSSGRLKYLTLFGKASMDYRNITGNGFDYVPCYESLDNPAFELTFGTDDYFGLMDEDEGENAKGRVDIGVGRLPVVSVAEAETMMRKIRHYDDLANTYGEWKLDYLLLSDSEKSSYVNDNEAVGNILDTMCPPLNPTKVYCGAYPKVYTASGFAIPSANADLMSAIRKGVSVMSYTGHGGVRGLSEAKVFTNADIASLDNYDKMPFVYTATCEFTKYDEPGLVSAGELLMLNPVGGSVALFSACRPTYSHHNTRQTKALMKYLTQRDESGLPMRFGDIVRKAKSDSFNYETSNPKENLNIRYLLLGDPALRLALPKENIVVLKFNGRPVGSAEDIQLHAMSMVSLEGEVRGGNGIVDSGFNGTLWVRLYDQKTKIRVKFSDDTAKNFYYHKDMLYQGRVNVANGKFTVSFQVPQDIAVGYGKPRFAFYAYDSIRCIDAMGRYDELVLGGVDPLAIADNEGPQIKFYWNTPAFENGTSVERRGVLYADLYDAQGIYHYDYSLGRDIILSCNHSEYDRMILNDSFEPTMNDFRRGRITVPIDDLVPGNYEFGLKVWDTQNNASMASLWFVVDDDLFLSHVYNYPNPFDQETCFTMTHVGKDGSFDINIEIFDIMGRTVGCINKRVNSTNGVIEPIRWDSRDTNGIHLKSGVYLYRFTMTDETGYFRTVSQRMLIQH